MKKLAVSLVLLVAAIGILCFLARDYISAEILPHFRGEYRGPEISKIAYSYSANGAGCDYVLDFGEGRYYFSSSADPVDLKYEYICDLDPALKDEFTTDAYRCGLFDVAGEYKNYGTACGYGWGLTIHFADGTQKHSEGANNAPRRIFEAVDALLEKYYGISVLDNSLPDLSRLPDLNCRITQRGGERRVAVKRIAATNYVLHQNKRLGVDNIDYALSDGTYLFREGEEYLLSLDPEEIDSIEVVSLSPDGDGERDVELTVGDGFSFVAEVGRIYVITVRRDGGYFEYPLSTCEESLDALPEDFAFYFECDDEKIVFDSSEGSFEYKYSRMIDEEVLLRIYRTLRESGVLDLEKTLYKIKAPSNSDVHFYMEYGNVNASMCLRKRASINDSDEYGESDVAFVETVMHELTEIVKACPVGGRFKEDERRYDGYAIVNVESRYYLPNGTYRLYFADGFSDYTNFIRVYDGDNKLIASGDISEVTVKLESAVKNCMRVEIELADGADRREPRDGFVLCVVEVE